MPDILVTQIAPLSDSQLKQLLDSNIKQLKNTINNSTNDTRKLSSTREALKEMYFDIDEADDNERFLICQKYCELINRHDVTYH